MTQRLLGTLFVFLSLGLAAPAFADEGSVKILSPADGATLDAMAQNKISYEVAPGSKGDHVHLYVDNKEATVIRQLKGSYPLETLAPGNHNLCIKVVDKSHTPVGVEKCVKVTVK